MDAVLAHDLCAAHGRPPREPGGQEVVESNKGDQQTIAKSDRNPQSTTRSWITGEQLTGRFAVISSDEKVIPTIGIIANRWRLAD